MFKDVSWRYELSWRCECLLAFVKKRSRIVNWSWVIVCKDSIDSLFILIFHRVKQFGFGLEFHNWTLGYLNFHLSCICVRISRIQQLSLRYGNNHEKLERGSNQHSLDVKMLIFLQYILTDEKGNKQFCTINSPLVLSFMPHTPAHIK
jgi:hypothetical protein